MSSFIPFVSSSPPPLDDTESHVVNDHDDEDDFGGFTSAPALPLSRNDSSKVLELSSHSQVNQSFAATDTFGQHGTTDSTDLFRPIKFPDDAADVTSSIENFPPAVFADDDDDWTGFDQNPKTILSMGSNDEKIIPGFEPSNSSSFLPQTLETIKNDTTSTAVDEIKNFVFTDLEEDSDFTRALENVHKIVPGYGLGTFEKNKEFHAGNDTDSFRIVAQAEDHSSCHDDEQFQSNSPPSSSYFGNVENLPGSISIENKSVTNADEDLDLRKPMNSDDDLDLRKPEDSSKSESADDSNHENDSPSNDSFVAQEEEQEQEGDDFYPMERNLKYNPHDDLDFDFKRGKEPSNCAEDNIENIDQINVTRNVEILQKISPSQESESFERGETVKPTDEFHPWKEAEKFASFDSIPEQEVVEFIVPSNDGAKPDGPEFGGTSVKDFSDRIEMENDTIVESTLVSDDLLNADTLSMDEIINEILKKKCGVNVKTDSMSVEADDLESGSLSSDVNDLKFGQRNDEEEEAEADKWSSTNPAGEAKDNKSPWTTSMAAGGDDEDSKPASVSGDGEGSNARSDDLEENDFIVQKTSADKVDFKADFSDDDEFVGCVKDTNVSDKQFESVAAAAIDDFKSSIDNKVVDVECGFSKTDNSDMKSELKSNEEEDDFDDFDDFQACTVAEDKQSVVVDKTASVDEWSAFGKGEVAKDDDDDDDWAAFGEPVAPTGQSDVSTTVKAEEIKVQGSGSGIVVPSTIKQLPSVFKMPQGEAVSIALQASFSQQSVDVEENVESLIRCIACRVPKTTENKNVLQPVSSVGGGAFSKVTPQSSTADVCVWNNLKVMEDTMALKYSWAGSAASQRLLQALNVDTRNILVGHKRSVPIFAPDLGLLKPNVSTTTTTSNATNDHQQQPAWGGGGGGHAVDRQVSWSSSVDGNRTSTTGGDVAGVFDIPLAQFDWSSSGLTNPLDAASAYQLDLDFFVHKAKLSSLLISEASEKEKELLESLEPTRVEPLKNNSLETLLASMTSAQFNVYGGRREDEGRKISEEALRILNALPDLSFMTSKVLIFPLKGET